MAGTFEDSEYFKVMGERKDTDHQGGKAATDFLLAQIPLNAQTKLLEIGCGSGRTLQVLNAMNLEQLIAIDISQQSIDWAKEALPDAAVSRADAQRLPFPDSSFDIVLIESVLIFCNIEQALREVYRVMKKGATLALNETLLLSPTMQPHVAKLQEIARLSHLSSYMEDDWRRAFQNAGFEVQWQSIKPMNRLKVFMLLQYMGVQVEFTDDDLIGYGLWTLEKREPK